MVTLLKMRSKIYILRVVLAAIGGIISGIFKLGLEAIGESIMMIVFFYILSIYITIYVIKARPGVNEISLKNVFLEGAGAFVMTWLFIWILLYNILLI